MQLYMENDPAPNPRRVRLFMAERGVSVPEVRVPLRERAHKAPEFLVKNSLGQVPALELDDGTVITETIAICRYLDLTAPGESLFGFTPTEQALVEMWVRRVEFVLMTPVGQFWRHAHPFTAHLLTQFKDFGESNREAVARAAKWLDRELGDGRAWLVGERFTVADIAALTTLDFADFIGLPADPALTNLAAWRARVNARPAIAPYTMAKAAA